MGPRARAARDNRHRALPPIALCARHLPPLGIDSGLAEDFPEERDADVSLMRVRDAKLERGLAHELMLGAAVGPIIGKKGTPDSIRNVYIYADSL